MRRWLEGIETFAIDVILERRYGRRADLLHGSCCGCPVFTRESSKHGSGSTGVAGSGLIISAAP